MHTNHPAVRVEKLSKRYRIGVREQYRTFRDAIADTAAAPLRRFKRLREGGTEGGTVWALKEVNLEIQPGDAVGIIGRNGAGKSTLLKILSRVTQPTEGHIELRGRVASLLEIGTGFHPELTGRENLYLSGSILGMSRGEIQRKFDEMVAFADVAKFIDTPVKRYSSGMYVRLAFAVAAHLEPEILLVDEVLAVGDMEFQKKCLGRMGAVAREGRTVLFVIHNMAAITRLCRQALWLDSGTVRASGTTDDVVSKYVLSAASTAGERRWPGGIANPGVTDMRIHSACIRDQSGNVTSTVQASQPFSVLITYSVTKRLPFCRIGIILRTGEGTSIFESYHSDNEQYAGPHDPGNYTLACEIPANLLATTRYVLTINAGITGIQNLAFLDGVLTFDVEDTGAVGAHMWARREGVIRPRLQWEREVTLP